MRYAVRHQTRFDYAFPVRFARCNLRLHPVDWDGQTVEDYHLSVDPAGQLTRARDGGYLAITDRLVVNKPASKLLIESRSTISIERDAPAPALDDLTVAQAGIAAAGLRALDTDEYDGSATELDTSPAQAFAAKRGVCQDFAQIMISGARAAGIAAAYVSGYLRTVPPAGKERLIGADATHAWVMLWCGPDRGWLGFDPTNGVAVGADHIICAIGRDYADVSPIDGIFLGRDGQKIEVAVDVEPLADAGALTPPPSAPATAQAR